MEQTTLRNAWLADLRSGLHKQGFGFLHAIDLHDNEIWCPLGRLCEITGCKWRYYKSLSQDKIKVKGVYGVEGYNGSAEYLTIPPRDIINKINYVEVTRLNDIVKLSFPEIADWLEETWKNEAK